MICKNCDTEMERVFSYDSHGEGDQILKCPNCGAHTKAREITFTEEGNVILATNKEGKPILAYQVANPEDEKTYGNIISIKQEKPKDNKKLFKKPMNKGNKKKRKENNAG